MEYPIARAGPPLGGPRLAAPARAQIIPFGCGSNGQINDHTAAPIGGSARVSQEQGQPQKVTLSLGGHAAGSIGVPGRRDGR